MKTLAYIFAIAASVALVAGETNARTDNTGTLHTTQIQTTNGLVEVRWGQPEAKSFDPAPGFSQLDTSDDAFVSESEANAYPLLANDFEYADSNQDQKISKDEYEKWRKAK